MSYAPMPPDQVLAVARLRQWAVTRVAVRAGRTCHYQRQGWTERTSRQNDAAQVRVIDFDLVLATLSGEEQTALVLTYRDRQTSAQVAIACGCSVRKLAYLLPGARAHLADALDRRDLL